MPRQATVRPWMTSPLFWTEVFAIGNIGFLAVDVAMAHAINDFEHKGEYVPVFFSMIAAPLLVVAMLIGGPSPPTRATARDAASPDRARLARWIGLLVGWGSILVGVVGLILHLNDAFFLEQTLKNLVYTAPFVAPLAYAGLGLLILLNRMVDARSLEWALWVVVLAAGGWAGNFILSLADHAQNGFFYPSEWVGVIAAAIAFGFLIAVLVVQDNRPLQLLTIAVLAVQFLVGLVGFYLHVRANLTSPTTSLWESFVFGAPVFAPLLFNDLAILGLLGMWGLMANSPKTEG